MHATSPEFVAVVLAASTGARLFPLTSREHPKHLLPVGGIPILARLLSVLHATGFTQLVICVTSDDSTTAGMLRGVHGVELEGSAYVFQSTLHVTCVSNDSAGSAEALKAIGDALPPTSHVMVLPGDLVVLETSSLVALVDAHRQGNTFSEPPSACTMLLLDVGEQDEHGVPLKESAKAKKGGLAREEEDIEYIGLAMTPKAPPRVVWKQSKIDVEQDEEFTGNAQKLVLPKPRLRGGTTRIRMDWSDVHAYIFSPWVRHLWNVRPALVSVQGDLIPLLVGRQFQGIQPTFGSVADNDKGVLEPLEGMDLTKEYAVRACVLLGSRVMRASTIPSYLYACREVVAKAMEDETNPCVALPEGASLNSKFFSAILRDSEMGDKVQCKSCTIGRNVRLSAKCRLNNVVVHDNVTVGENCVLQNSILAEGCSIGENCNLNDCQVPPGKSVPAGTKEKGESFMDDV
jgi:translation initiation factor eIF-2B subunit gamma